MKRLVAILAVACAAACTDNTLDAPMHRVAPPNSSARDLTGPPGTIWARQFGSSGSDGMGGVVTLNGAVFVAGTASAALPGQTALGASDGFLRRYDGNGNEVWTRQFGSDVDDNVAALATDGTALYVGGSTDGALGPGRVGGTDAFIAKYDANGNLLWTRQFGSFNLDAVNVMAADASGVYAFGTTCDALPGQTNAGGCDVFLRKYDANGTEQWTRQFGTSSFDQPWGIWAADGAVYVSGQTGGALPGQTAAGFGNAFVRKYDASGNEQWTREFGANTFFNPAAAVAVNATGVYVAGGTEGALPGQTNAGGEDAWIRKYDLDGTEVWTRQFGTSNIDDAFTITLDGSGVYIAGRTWGALAPTAAALGDIFARKYDFDGNVVWTQQFGSPGVEDEARIAADATGLYVGGFTTGTLGGQTSAGGNDVFLVKLNLDAAPADATPPVITPIITGTLGNDGWYVSNVTVAWNVSDPESPVTSAPCDGGSVTSNTSGTSFTCDATSSGGSATKTVVIKRDATPPTVAYTGNAGAYTVDQHISIACSASDDVSSLATRDCASIDVDAYTLTLGSHTYTASATDVAGNSNSATATFTVSATPASVCALVERWTTNAGVANSLCVKLRAGSYEAFRNEVSAQAGKQISDANAALLIALSKAL